MQIGKTFKEDFVSALKEYPGLEYEILPGGKSQIKYKVTGDFPIVDADGTTWEIFRGSIYFKSSYPFGFASLQEVSNIIPRQIDRHISVDGLCCVCGLLESLEMETKAFSILKFIQKYVIPFFANQVHYKHFGFFLNGEYSHNYEGIWEELEFELQITDKQKMKSILMYIACKPGRNQPCFCGSGKKLKVCHMTTCDKVLRLLKLKPDLL